MASAQVRAQGRALEQRLRRAGRGAVLAALGAELGGAEAAALGAALGGAGQRWARRLRLLALERGDTACAALLRALERLQEPGPFDFYNPQRDSEPSHRSDCPCCQPMAGQEGGDAQEEEDGDPEDEAEGPEEEEEDGEPEEGDGDPEEEEGEDGDPQEEAEGPEEEEGDEGPEEEEGDTE
ncbi:uncharacterized protein LJ264_015928 [Porphyrio hochstetteri]